MTPSCSLFCIYIGFSGKIDKFTNSRYSTFIYGDEVDSLKKVYSNNHGDWSRRSFVLVDYGSIDSALAPEGKSFGVICAADRLEDWAGLDEKAYRLMKEKVAEILLGRLEKTFPGIMPLIETHEIATPRTIKRYTLNPYGAPYGFAQTPSQAGFKRPSYKSPLKNLWFSGNWTFPGGGFTGALVSGFLCGLKVNEKLENKPVKKSESEFTDNRIVRLLKKEEVAANTLELTFEKPEAFEFQAGQYVHLSLPDPVHKDLDVAVRTLSIASHPDEAELRFVMRKSPSSFKKSCEELGYGDPAIVYGPVGEFTLNLSLKGVVFLVSGIGISPVIPMLRELEKREYEEPVYLFYSNKTESQAAYHGQLGNPGLKNFNYIPVFTGKEDRINALSLEKRLCNPWEYEYYIVGTSGFLSSMIEILGKNGVADEQVHLDDFG